MSVHSDQAPSPVAAVVILAAGEGKRMKSSRSKLLHEIAGHSMLSYAVTAATTVQPEHIVVVVGHLRDQVEAHLAEIAPHVLTAVQERAAGHRRMRCRSPSASLRSHRRGDRHLWRRADAHRRDPRRAAVEHRAAARRRSPC